MKDYQSGGARTSGFMLGMLSLSLVAAAAAPATGPLVGNYVRYLMYRGVSGHCPACSGAGTRNSMPVVHDRAAYHAACYRCTLCCMEWIEDGLPGDLAPVATSGPGLNRGFQQSGDRQGFAGEGPQAVARRVVVGPPQENSEAPSAPGAAG